jgi:hypothetical protein
MATPSNLFISQTCTIAAGSLTGTFTVDASAPANTYTVTVQTDMGPVDSATSTFTVTPTYSVAYYADPPSGQILADGSSETDGTMVTGYSEGQRVHIVANGPSGYQFASWEASGVSIDNTSSPDTYMTVANSGSVKAHFTPIMYTITFYADPASGTITADGATKTSGVTSVYPSGAHVTGPATVHVEPTVIERFTSFDVPVLTGEGLVISTVLLAPTLVQILLNRLTTIK